MRLEVLSHLVVKLIIGFFMLAQSLYNIATYSSYIPNLESHLTNTSLLNNEFLHAIAPLFPFVEFALGLMIILEVYYKEAALLTVLLFCSTTILYVSINYRIASTLVMLLFSLLSIWLFISRVAIHKHKNFSYL